jgi:hypothetical protein
MLSFGENEDSKNSKDSETSFRESDDDRNLANIKKLQILV